MSILGLKLKLLFLLEGHEERWVQSNHKDDYGKMALETGKWNDIKGLKTTEDAKFYAVSSGFDSFSNKDKTLVVQLTVQHGQKIDCGGGYVKVTRIDKNIYAHYAWLSANFG